jgi:hypothetical protein
MQCPHCCYRRKKSDCNPHWQCPRCEKAYNKVHTKNVNKSSTFAKNNVTYNDWISDFFINFFPNVKGILKIVSSIFLLFWGVEELLTEGHYYISNYYLYYQEVLGNDMFFFFVLIIFILFIIGIVIYIGRKVVNNPM